MFDRLLQPLFDRALDFEARIVFCTAVDVNGFLPTHNSKFSQSRGKMRWNAAHCRNRRFFKDRVDLRPGKMKKRFFCRRIAATWEGADLSPWSMFPRQFMRKGVTGEGCGWPTRSILPRNEGALAQTYLQFL